MKTLKLIIAFLAIASFTQKSFAQDKTIGLYLTYDDYLNHKLSFETKGNAGTSISLNEFLEGSTVTVCHDSKKEVFSKSEIFGYHSQNGDYRFFNNKEYKIIDSKDFYIYSRTKLVQQGKNLKPIDTYYFSTDGKAVVEPLTIRALENTYAENANFKYSIESQFQTDNELTKYDASIQEYKVKYLYEQCAR